MSELLGKVFERKYRLVRLLGEGGMGAVYEAEHTLLNRTVAVKVMHPNIATNPEAVDRFFREAQSASAIGHPNIIEIHDVGKDVDGTVFMVMELLKGENLDSLVKKRGALPPARAISIVLQILSALFAAHKKGIIHRDLKADNVFLAIDTRMREEVKLLDFGIAKVADAGHDTDMGLTKPGTVMGTPHYLSPEQAKGGKNIDHRIDIWTTGVLLYEMLTAHLPFYGDNYNEILSRVLLDTPSPISKYVQDVPEPLVKIVNKALAKDRDERYSDVAEMIEELMPLQDHAAYSMSTSAVNALKDSVVPPPYSPRNGDTREESQPASVVVPVTPVTPDTRIESLSPDLIQTIGLESLEPEAKKRRAKSIIYAVAGVAATAAVAIALVSGLGKTEEPLIGPNTPEKGTSVSVEQKTKTAPETGPKPIHKSQEFAAEPGSALKPANIANVTIAVTGLPPGARVTLDKKQVALPLTLPRSDQPVILKVTALNHFPFKKALVLNRDHTIEVAMKKIASKKTEAAKTRSTQVVKPRAGTTSKKNFPPKPAKKKKKKDKIWVENPFGD
ncbi:MAG: serine/threonine protein kinase [Proteobacteria bacterium]|nr:serine/threonine protein kinase [Pseudomonadota bacterium]